MKRLIGFVAVPVGAVAAVWIIWAVWGVQFLRNLLGPEVATLGQVGDLFGGINALFSALALVGVAFAAYFQWNSWKLLLAERTQNSFEPMFFQLLQLLRDLQPKTWQLHGRPASVSEFTSSVHGVIKARLDELEKADWEQRAAICEEIYLWALSENSRELLPFLNTTVVLLRRVDSANGLSGDAKREFAAIVWASLLVDIEVVLLIVGAAARVTKSQRRLLLELDVCEHPSEDGGHAVDQLVRLMYFEALLADEATHEVAAENIRRAAKRRLEA